MKESKNVNLQGTPNSLNPNITEWESSDGYKKLQYIPTFDHYRFCTKTLSGGWTITDARYPASKWSLAKLLENIN